LRPLLPPFLTYVLSFLYIAIYWNNHHHMFHLVDRISGTILWANLHLLFWLSLVPFITGWMGENHFAPLPTAVYGVVLFMAGVAYYVLQGRIIALQGKGSKLREAVDRDLKGKFRVVTQRQGERHPHRGCHRGDERQHQELGEPLNGRCVGGVLRAYPDDDETTNQLDFLGVSGDRPRGQTAGRCRAGSRRLERPPCTT
jgi:hypothetical protein